MKISACVITKNEEKNIVKWLECMGKLADQLVVVDTGSNDLTCEIAKKFGAEIFSYKWENDFSAAKNFAIEQAVGDWIVFLDADEYFTDGSIINIKRYLNLYNKDKNVDALICKIINIDADDNDRIISHFYNLRIFKNIDTLRFKNKVHECIAKESGQLNIRQLGTDVEIYHSGYSSSIIKKKLDRNLQLMQNEIAVNKEPERYYGFLCDCYYGLGEYEEAVKYANLALASGIKLVGQENTVYRRLIDSLRYLKKDNETIMKIVDEAVQKFPELPEFLVDKGIIFLKDKNYIEAEKNFNSALELFESKEVNILMNFAKKYIILYYLGEVAVLKNNRAKALDFFSEALVENKYNEAVFDKIYELINDQEDTIIIQFLNLIYENSKQDLKFLLGRLPKNKVWLYYLSKYEENNDSIKDQYNIEKLMIAEKYDTASDLLFDKLQKTYKMILINTIISGETLTNDCKEILPPKYKKAFSAMDKNEKDNIFTIKDKLNIILAEKTSDKMDLSIIIINYNEENLSAVIKDIKAIEETRNEKYEIIVLSFEKIIREETAEFVEFEVKNNLAKLYNDIIVKTKADKIFFIDSNLIITEELLAGLLNKINDYNYSILAPITNCNIGYGLNFDIENKSILEIRQEVEKIEKYLLQENKNKYDNKLFLEHKCCIIKKQVFDKIGNFDLNITEGSLWQDFFCRMILGGFDLNLTKELYAFFLEVKEEEIFSVSFKEKWGFDFYYSTGARNDIINILELERNNLNILEIGCACGGTLQEIKNINPKTNVFGIEINENAAKIAKMIGQVSSEDIEETELSFQQEFFDYIILGDVLEHLYNPQKVLENIKPYLKVGGKIVASIPNIQHWSIIEELLKGNWTYADAGILDKTHLNFFTRNEIFNLFDKTGYEVIQFIGKDIGLTETARNMLDNLLKNELIHSFDDFIAYQWLVEVEKLKH